MKDPRPAKDGCSDNAGVSGISRRTFVNAAATVVATAAAIPLEPLIGEESVAEAAGANNSSVIRMTDCFNYRVNMAQSERINNGPQPDNGDIARFTDFSGNFSKTLLHDSLGVPNAGAYASFRNAFASGNAGFRGHHCRNARRRA